MIMLFFLFFLVVFVVTVMALFFYFRYHRPSQSQIESDIAQLKLHIRPLIAGLKPWPDSETELLCTHTHRSKKRISWKDLRTGVLKTIYDEDIVAWACYSYKSEQPNSLYLLRYANWREDIILRIRRHEAYVLRGDMHMATLNTDWAFTDPRSNKVICRIVAQADGSHFELSAGGRGLAILMPPEKSDQLKPRLFQWIDVHDSDEAYAVRLFGVIWLLLQQEKVTPLPS
jgi:hypothetical protein